MGLRIVYGRAGSGKTAFCLKEIEERLRTAGNLFPGDERASGGKCPLILIVPEQFSLQAEKNLAKISAFFGVPGAEALSFRRMAFRVFSEVGGITRRHLNAAGKSMLLFRIMKKLVERIKNICKSSFQKRLYRSPFRRHHGIQALRCNSRSIG
ncbi:MAG: hypothetical protein ACOX4M_05100 [Acetivibrionales bacterium]